MAESKVNKTVSKKVDELADKVDSLSDKVVGMATNTIETKVLLSEHLRQDERKQEDMRNLMLGQSAIEKHLAEYNFQLQIHIAGVAELKKANALLQEKIDLEKKELVERLDTAELPIKWALHFAKIARYSVKIAKWITAMVGAIAAIAVLLKVISGAATWTDLIKLLGL